ncbi:Serine-threonine/tyrosine-protein kinase [Theobroma cacao]|nr:Serine-threonine/tyrosine-protein kinase [Theobroma cacao]
MDVLVAATDNFSETNPFGRGGFGTVYKSFCPSKIMGKAIQESINGILPSGEGIAVKNLQLIQDKGEKSPRMKVRLLLRMQNRNLVQLLGSCVHGEERILSLDRVLFRCRFCILNSQFFVDKNKSTLLDWGQLHHIIKGVASGLIYLHQDSVLRIIHRDIIARNILLDNQINPKILDFGFAKLVNDKKVIRGLIILLKH